MQNYNMRNVILLTRDHLDAITAIETASFASPWTAPMLSQEFDLSYSSVWGVFEDSKLYGFAVVWQYCDEAHITDFAVTPEVRRRGFGKDLLDGIFCDLRKKKTVSVFLEVRESNNAAIELYKKFGFRSIGVRQKYYSDNSEDALVMQVSLAYDDKQ